MICARMGSMGRMEGMESQYIIPITPTGPISPKSEHEPHSGTGTIYGCVMLTLSKVTVLAALVEPLVTARPT